MATSVTKSGCSRTGCIALLAAGAVASAAVGAVVALAIARRPRPVKKILAPSVQGLPLFSSATVHGDTIYVSGTLGTLPGGKGLIKGETKVMNAKEQLLADITAETTQTLLNIKTILEQVHGITAAQVAADKSLSPLNKITKVNVSLKDDSPEAFAAMNAAYKAFFEQHSTCFSDAKVGMPARMTSKNVYLALNAQVEIEVIAGL